MAEKGRADVLMVDMAINNFHPDSVAISVVAYSLDQALVDLLSGTGVVVPHKISELEHVVHSEVVKFFKDYQLDENNITTEVIFDQDVVEVRVLRIRGKLMEHLFSIKADRWKKNAG
jgi:hypothetical protein